MFFWMKEQQNAAAQWSLQGAVISGHYAHFCLQAMEARVFLERWDWKKIHGPKEKVVQMMR